MKSLLLLSLFVAPLLFAVEEAGIGKSFGPMERGSNDYRLRTNTPEAAVSRLHFCGQVLPTTEERLKKVWKSGTGYSDRLDALHAWMKELEKDPHSTDAQVFLAWQAAHIWFASHGAPEHDLFMQHIRHTFSSPAPAYSRHLMSLFYQIHTLESLSGTGCVCDDMIALTDAVNGVNPWMLDGLYAMRELGDSRMDVYNRLWRDPVAYAPQFINDRQDYACHALHLLLNDVPYLLRTARGQGLRRWRYTWGKDLPPAVDAAMEAIDARRSGDIPPAAATAARIRSLTAGLEPDMLGFVPRSILAAAPTATAWRPLWDDKASLYDMPDTTAISLPGWNLKLLSKEGSAPATVLNADVAKLHKLLQRATTDKTLPAMLAFSLIEDDLAMPDEEHRSWMGVEGYDTFHAVFDIEMSPHLLDVLIDEKGPHFSRDDETLRAACRELNLTLHRCIVSLALLEQQGNTQAVQKGCETLASLFNSTKTWPLVFNEYGLRGISPFVFTELVSRCQGKPELLRSFAELAHAGMAYSAAEQDGGGTPSAERLAGYIRSMLVLRRELAVPEKDRCQVAQEWMKAAESKQPNTREAMEQYAFAFGAPEPLLQTIPENAAAFSGPRALRGLCLYRYAAEHGDQAAAQRIISSMTADPLAYGYPATRLACALRARSEGREAEAQRFEKDALVLYLAEAQFAESYRWWQSSYAFLQYGPLADAVKLMGLRRQDINRSFLAYAVPALLERRQYENAAFAAEQLINLCLRDATPNNSCGTHRQIVAWRAMADIGHALHLQAKGEKATADKLVAAARPLLGGDTTLAARVLPVLEQAAPPAAEEPDGVMATAAHDISFDSPVYTWHLKDYEGGFNEVKGRIEYAWYENETESCWVRIRTESGRCIQPFLNEISQEDIANLIDWRKLNKIEQFHSVHPGYGAFAAKLCRLYSDAEHPTAKNTYAELLRPYGARRVLLVSSLEEEEQKALMACPITREKPALRCFDTLGKALAEADAEEADLRLCFLGKQGGETDTRFRKTILSNADTLRQWRRSTPVTMLCYQAEDGGMTPESQAAYDMVRESLDAMIPPGSPMRASLEQNGYIIEIRRHQGYGNRYAKSGDDVRLDIRIKPLFQRAENAALCEAVVQGQAENVEKLLAAGADASSIDAEGYPVLNLACRYGRARIVRMLLEKGADPNQKPLNNNPDAQLPLEAAQGNFAIIKLLSEHGARLTPQALGTILSQENGISAADELVAKRAHPIDWETRCPEYNGTLLTHFAREKNVEVVDWLLEHGADANAWEVKAQMGGYRQKLFVTTCCTNPNTDVATVAMAESFLKHGADPNTTVENIGIGKPFPLLLVCINNGKLEQALLLLQYGADADICDSLGRPVLYTLLQTSTFPKNASPARQALIVKLADSLVQHGADVNRCAPKKLPLKQWARKQDNGRPRVSPTLLEWLDKQ